MSVKWYGMFVEQAEGGKLSLGRILCTLTFGIMVYFWLMGHGIPDSMLTVFWTTLGYNASKKVTSPVRDYLAERLERRQKSSLDQKADDE